MKPTFFLLILINVIVLLWETGYGRNPDESYQELPIPSNVEKIVLINELADTPTLEPEAAEAAEAVVEAEPDAAIPAEAAAESEEVPVPEAPEPPAPPPGCFNVGPFPDQARATEVLDLLKPQSFEARTEERPGDVPDGWWVIFPKASSLELARENGRALAQKGVQDMWVFDRGPLLGAISLGLYDNRDKAVLAQRQFADKNIVTEVVPRLVRGRVHWLRIPWEGRPALELEEIVETLNSQDPDARIPAPVACPAS
jgi:hypothetical protein